MYKFIALCALFAVAHGGAVPLISGISHTQRIQSHGPAVPVVAAHAVAPVAVAHAVAPAVVATHAVAPAVVSAGHAIVPAGAIVSNLGGVAAISPIGYGYSVGYHAPIVSNIGIIGGKIIG